MPILDFCDLDRLHSGVTNGIALALSEAAEVCLSRHHLAPVEFDLLEFSPSRTRVVSLRWVSPSREALRAWNNSNEATEFGACAIGIAAVYLSRHLQVVARAETGSGADYFLAPIGAEPDDLENCVRLELSGVDKGTQDEVKRRVASKLAQAERGNLDTPALAAVTGFRSRLIVVAGL